MMLVYPIGIPQLFLVVLFVSVRPCLLVPSSSSSSSSSVSDQSLRGLVNHSHSSLSVSGNLAYMREYKRAINRRLAIEQASKLPSTAPFVSLFAAYRPELWFFECTECVRRLALSSLLAFVFPDTDKQVVIAVLIWIFFLVVYS